MRLIKTLLTLSLFYIIGCSPNKKIIYANNEEIDKIVKETIREKKLENFIVYNKINNESLHDFIDQYIILDDSGSYSEFGPLRQWVPDQLLDSLFNKGEIEKIKLSLNESQYRKWSDTKTIFEDAMLVHDEDSISKETKTVRFSLPVIFKNKGYALIRFDSSLGVYDSHGFAQTLLFEKRNGKWTLIHSVPLR